MRMSCRCYYNNTGFKVGTKYLSLYDAYTGRVIDKVSLYPALISELEDIKEEYDPYDVNRTCRVMDVFYRELGMGGEYEY